jgi:hypothetical protein
MIVIGFYFDNNGGWIEYSQDGQIVKQEFTSGDEVQQFIKANNLPLTYKGCVDQ